MQVNYVREHERFIEYAADERLTPNEQLLWYALVHIFNQRAEGSEWPDGFIRITNDRMFTYLPIKWDAMAKARNSLKQRGLIDFRNGSRNKSAPEYKVNWFYPSCYPFKTDNTGGNVGGNTGGNTRGNERGNLGGFYSKHKQETNVNQETDEEDDDDDVNRAGASALPWGEDPIEDRRERVRLFVGGFSSAFGRLPYPAEGEKLINAIWVMGFSTEMLYLAMRKAAANGARNPVELTLSILQEWRDAEVRTPEQAEQYQVEYDSRTGRNGLYGSGDVVEDYHAAEEAKRRRREENRRAGIDAW